MQKYLLPTHCFTVHWYRSMYHVLSSQDKSMTDMENIELWHILVQNTVLMLQIRAYMNIKQLNFKGNLFSVFYKQKSCSATIMSQDDKMWFFLSITHKTVPRSQFFAFSNQSMIVLKNENQFNSALYGHPFSEYCSYEKKYFLKIFFEDNFFNLVILC